MTVYYAIDNENYIQFPFDSVRARYCTPDSCLYCKAFSGIALSAETHTKTHFLSVFEVSSNSRSLKSKGFVLLFFSMFWSLIVSSSALIAD